MTSVLPLPLQSISVIIVGHQSAADLEELLPSLVSDLPLLGLEIIVVDNDSSDDTHDVINRFKDQVIYIRNNENLGFATAVNQGIDTSRAPYILLLNPDARISSDALQELKRYLDKHEKAGAVAPRLEFPDGSLQPSRGSFPSAIRTFAHLFQLKRIMPDDESVMKGPFRFLGRLFQQYSKPEDVQIVDYTTGACVLLRRSILNDIGGLDENFFLYYEEIDLAKRIKESGFQWIYLDKIVAYHTVAASSEKAPLRPFLERYRSMCYYYSKHHAFPVAFLVRQMLYVSILIRWGLTLISSRFRMDPDVPVQVETSVYKRLLKRRIHKGT